MVIHEEKKTLKLYSHPRSGTHWTVALLAQVFEGGVTLGSVRTGHWSERLTEMVPNTPIRGRHPFYHDGLKEPRLYLYRDGRDVVLSMWRTKIFQPKTVRGFTFSEFLRWKLDWRRTPGCRAKPQQTITDHWRSHLDSWAKAPNTYFVCYEQLLQDTEAELARIGEFVGLPVLEYREPGGMGPAPSGDYRVCKWSVIFTEEDLDYFFKIVPHDFWGLWEKESV